MAEGLRKNIYISQEDSKLFLECEKYAKENNITMSNLIIKSLKKYKQQIDNSIITLIIKKNEGTNKLGEYKKIQFKGKKITSIDTILGRNEQEAEKLKNNLSFGKNDKFIRKYIFYKSESGKLIIYIRTCHSTFNSDYEECKMKNCSDYKIIEEESEYHIFDNINQAVNQFPRIVNECINELILELAETEILDI